MCGGTAPVFAGNHRLGVWQAPFFAGKRLSFHICFRTIEITSQTIYETVSPVNGKIVSGLLFFVFLFLCSILLGRECCPLMLSPQLFKGGIALSIG